MDAGPSVAGTLRCRLEPARFIVESDMRLAGWISVIGIVAVSPACNSQAPMSPTNLVRALAPIEQVDINVAESFPPQYFAAIVSLVSMATESCTLWATENCTLWGESCRAAGTFSR